MALDFNTGPYGSAGTSPRSPGTFRETGLTPTSRTRTKTQIQVTTTVDLSWTSVDEACATLRAAAEGLTDDRVEVATYEEYDSTYARTTVSGWRDATPEEVADRAEYTAWHAARPAEAEDRQVAARRAARPELFVPEPLVP